MSIVVDAQYGPVLQAYARRPLDLNDESICLVLDPADLEMLAIKGSIEDLGRS